MNPARSALGGATDRAEAAGRPAAPLAAGGPDDVAVLLVADLRPDAVAWGWWRLVRGPGALRGTPGLKFAKILGSGADGRFGLRPSASVRGLFGVFDGVDAARAFAAGHPLVDAFRARAGDFALLVLRATSSRGQWSGRAIGVGAPTPAGGPVASLTRASIRPASARRFWKLAPAAQRSLDEAPGCRFAVGLGEAPLLRQATFSLWDDQAAMDAYARRGAHQDAIRAAREQRFFGESMFVRFQPLQLEGTWRGRRLDG